MPAIVLCQSTGLSTHGLSRDRSHEQKRLCRVAFFVSAPLSTRIFLLFSLPVISLNLWYGQSLYLYHTHCKRDKSKLQLKNFISADIYGPWYDGILVPRYVGI